ncbi:TPA: hypothetical protein ENX78_10465 [Candidatus Poribacteria bacterium]|nr:hypothetical protein [Candidatus Poribacteria bacterium]
MKKILFLIVILVLLLLTACTAQVIPAPTPNLTAAKEMSSVQTQSPTLTPTSMPSASNSDIKYAEMIPDPKVIFAMATLALLTVMVERLTYLRSPAMPMVNMSRISQNVKRWALMTLFIRQMKKEVAISAHIPMMESIG